MFSNGRHFFKIVLIYGQFSQIDGGVKCVMGSGGSLYAYPAGVRRVYVL